MGNGRLGRATSFTLRSGSGSDDRVQTGRLRFVDDVGKKVVTAINNLHVVSLLGLASWNVLELLWVVLLRMPWN